MGVLSGLEPKRVFEIFEELCAIPHGSTHTKAISVLVRGVWETAGTGMPSGRGRQRNPHRPGHGRLRKCPGSHSAGASGHGM